VTNHSAEAVALVLIEMTENWLKTARYVTDRFPNTATTESWFDKISFYGENEWSFVF
jgi:hypothetical protein